MIPVAPDRLPWFIAGPIIGLCVVALYGLANRRLGVTGSFVQIGSLLRDRAATEVWRLWLFVGLAGGAAIVGLVRGGPTSSLGYGALGLVLPLAALIPVLFMGGVLIGYGARWSRGCTSGHGISGTSSLSPASLVATGTFMATAVLVTFLLHLATGGAL
jgi:uncharacterized membrane protein YedE/YeeE